MTNTHTHTHTHNTELKSLIAEAHSKNLLVMADVVVNHMGQGMTDVPSLSPFNKTSFFHDCGCVDGDCCPKSCWVEDFHNAKQMLHCQLFGLPDLNQDLPEVAQELNKWIVWMIEEYDIDGIRLDTVPYVKSTYWKDFTNAANVFSIGEVSTPDLSEMETYVTSGAMDAVLQYPLYYSGVSSFGRMESFKALSESIKNAKSAFQTSIDYLGLFSENHDNPRFLSIRADARALKNFVLFILSAQGIPIVYYGVEQGYHGGLDFDANREPLWTSGFSTTKSWENMYTFVQTILKFRKSSAFYEFPPQELWADETFYAFSRGKTLFVFTNQGKGAASISRTLSGFGVPWKQGTKVCNIFYPTKDCIIIEKDYSIDIVLNDGECKVYYEDESTLNNKQHE